MAETKFPVPLSLGFCSKQMLRELKGNCHLSLQLALCCHPLAMNEACPAVTKPPTPPPTRQQCLEGCESPLARVCVWWGGVQCCPIILGPKPQHCQ